MNPNPKIIEARKMLLGYLAYKAKEKNISIEQISKKTGYTVINVERLLSGKYNPSLEIFITLAEAIDTYFFVVDKDEKDDEYVEFMKNRWEQNKNQS